MGVRVHRMQTELLLASAVRAPRNITAPHQGGWLRRGLPSQRPLLPARGERVDLQLWAATTFCLLLRVSQVTSSFLRVSLLLFNSFQPADGTKKITF